MLAAWLAHVQQVDPDAFYLYQVPSSSSPHCTSWHDHGNKVARQSHVPAEAKCKPKKLCLHRLLLSIRSQC